MWPVVRREGVAYLLPFPTLLRIDRTPLDRRSARCELRVAGHMAMAVAGDGTGRSSTFYSSVISPWSVDGQPPPLRPSCLSTWFAWRLWKRELVYGSVLNLNLKPSEW